MTQGAGARQGFGTFSQSIVSSSSTLGIETEMPPAGKKKRKGLMKELAPDHGYVDNTPSSPARKRKPTNRFNPNLKNQTSQLEIDVTPVASKPAASPIDIANDDSSDSSAEESTLQVYLANVKKESSSKGSESMIVCVCGVCGPSNSSSQSTP
jgi:hypothetical protein